MAWWNLTDADNNPASFWSNLVSALVASGAVPDRSPLRARHPAAMFVDADVDELWAQLADLPAPVVLVIDDFQVITHDDVLRQFGRLISELPPTALRLVLLTRLGPGAAVARLRVSGELTEIRAADLAFTPREVLSCSPGDACSSSGRAGHSDFDTHRGLAGRCPSRRPGRLIRPDVMPVSTGFAPPAGGPDHFVTEVLQASRRPDRDFLLRTSAPSY